MLKDSSVDDCQQYKSRGGGFLLVCVGLWLDQKVASATHNMTSAECCSLDRIMAAFQASFPTHKPPVPDGTEATFPSSWEELCTIFTFRESLVFNPFGTFWCFLLLLTFMLRVAL